jgi:RNA polymerase sigma-70 factor (ECF subfamily)
MDGTNRERPADSHLSRISTHWDLIAQAHGGVGPAATTAQHALLLRYESAVHRYLLAAVRDPQVADDLSQEFAVRWLAGEFRNADPSRGRFRSYLATALRHLVVDHFRCRQPSMVDWQSSGRLHPPSPPVPNETEAAFLAEWRQELLNAAWRELERDDTGDGLYYTVLRWRASNPDQQATAMADELTARFGRPFTAAGVRQTLRRARKLYAELLVDEVRRSLGEGASAEAVEQELGDLGLLDYCRPTRPT